jgi:phosphohistidine phosphatase
VPVPKDFCMKYSKVLHVVRHAKSSWDDSDVADVDRPLKSKGIRNAYEISRKLKLGNLIPQKIISSPADRALHTAVIFAGVFGCPFEHLEISEILYESSTEEILDLIRDTSDEYKSLMIFGHNPNVTDLVNRFIKSPVDNVPTSGVVTLIFNSEKWKTIDKKNLEGHVFNFPNKEE